MRNTHQIIALLSLFTVLTLSSAQAATVLEVDDNDLCHRAKTIFQGTCVEKQTSFDERGRIVTEFRFQVTEMLKGRKEAREVTFVQPGGRVGDRTLFISGVARFELGEEVVAFLGGEADSKKPTFTVGLAQGKFRVERSTGTASENEGPVVTQNLKGLETVGTQTGASHSNSKPTRRSLKHLLQSVRSKVKVRRTR